MQDGLFHMTIHPKLKKYIVRIQKKKYNLFHSAHSSRIGKEILFFSNNLFLSKNISSPVN